MNEMWIKIFLSLKGNFTEHIENILHSFSCHHLYSKYLTSNSGSKLRGPVYLVVLKAISKINKNYQAIKKKTNTTVIGLCQKDTGNQLKSSKWAKSKLFFKYI